MTSTVFSYQLNALPKFLSQPELRIKIKALDLEPIKYKLMKEYGWSLEKADQTEKIYKGFLLLNALYPSENHVPTNDIDEMWHAHILDTSKYMADCLDIFGEYIHHFPYLGLRGAEDEANMKLAFETTRKRFVEETGLDPLTHNAADCGGGCGSSCGSSCSSGDSGSDSGGVSTPFNDSTIISSCGSSSGNDSGRKQERKPTPPKSPPKPIWQRILGLSANDLKWEDSVNPRGKAQAKRPGRAEILMLDKDHTSGMSKH